MISTPVYQRLKFIIDDYIDRNYMHIINIDDLALLCGYSKFHFIRVFKKIYNVFFLKIYNGIPMRKSKTTFNKNPIFINDVAKKSGYNNTSYFNAVFKNMSGMKPEEYRQLNGNKFPSDIP